MRIEAPEERGYDMASAEKQRLAEIGTWRKWGPYLADRQWGTVREDYSPHGSAWDYFPHDHARSRAFRWGEDGIAGFSDEFQQLCFSLALWNGRDPILKERLFGLTGPQGNHGEDVKELYYYLDALPSHAYQRMLYKYPQAAFPYERLLEENARRGKRDPEFELLDTGVFAENRYFDVFIEVIKVDSDDLIFRIEAFNRGPEEAPLFLIPQLFFRNTWSWGRDPRQPHLRRNADRVEIEHHALGHLFAYADQPVEMVFCDNETNVRRLYQVEGPAFPKDAFNDYVVGGVEEAVNPEQRGTKFAALRRVDLAPGAATTLQIRLSPHALDKPFKGINALVAARRREADAFYAELQQGIDDEGKLIQRQAFAGMLWSKQFFYFDIPQWLAGDPAHPAPPAERKNGRNSEWVHLNNADIISMPDKWEYPWYAAWDLAFHCLPLALLDPEFAKSQLVLMTREWYMHPNGQLPAYEWAFGDVNPPVHAWATWRVFQLDRKVRRQKDPADPGDLFFLERVFHKLMLNFTWWVNRKDAAGRNIFQGGFLGLDNIGAFDRSAPLPTGGHINQSDGTSWMAMYSLNLMRIALELARHNKVYEDIATKFFEHFLHIAEAMTNLAGDGNGLWHEEDGFFYDVLELPGGRRLPMRLRSMVGLIPFFAVETLEPELLDAVPDFKLRLEWFLRYRPELASLVSRWNEPGRGDRRLLSLLRGRRMKQLLKRMLDESEFLSDFGIRALSKAHGQEPYRLQVDGREHSVQYLPGESDSGLFGGNSNWRGPIWFPVNFLLIESLQKFHHYYGDDFKVECPIGSGQFLTLAEAAEEIGRRLIKIFRRDASDRRPVFGTDERLQADSYFRDHLLFFEYFHGDSGRGVGAGHQTGWTGLVAKLLMSRRVS
jgi:Glycosyl hydrolase family 63 C-terminal domain